MITVSGGNWPYIISKTAQKLLDLGSEVHTGSWHAMDIKDDPKYTMHEALHVILQGPLHHNAQALSELSANVNWAEEHFQERISGIPYNPPPSHERWPFAQKNNVIHTDNYEKFSHTYPERFWSKFANHGLPKNSFTPENLRGLSGIAGIRFAYGDLDDVIKLLLKDPSTRQAFLPIWFPEDTGAVEGQRVPCTLGYHFIIRNGFLDVTYYMRSCDFVRNFRDDVYMACRLGQHVVEKFNGLNPENEILPRALIMTITSLHLFKSEIPLLENLCR